jgi:hypothetical protein
MYRWSYSRRSLRSRLPWWRVWRLSEWPAEVVEVAMGASSSHLNCRWVTTLRPGGAKNPTLELAASEGVEIALTNDGLRSTT